MTAVLDTPHVQEVPSAARTPGYPYLDLRLVALVVEQAAASAEAEPARSEAVLVDQIGLLESLQHSLAALQATLTRQFARRHVATRLAAGESDPAKLERSVAGQVALACRVSPTRARLRVRAARDLHDGLAHVRGLYAAGELGSRAVEAVVRAARDLDTGERAEVDRRLAAHDLTRLGARRIGDLARRLAAEVAPGKFRARVTAARADRRVTLRPGEDGMTWLTAHLPLEQGAACYATLDRAHRQLSASPEPLTRGRGQVMADTLVERVTGQASADAVPVEIQALVPVEALLDPDSPLPADIPGLGPIPVDLLTSSPGRLFLRRLVTRAGIVIGGESRRRTFRGLIAYLIRARSRHRCTEPYCDAPVRHLDHIHRAEDHGKTELDNGRGVCEFHNHLREQPGWHVHRTARGVETTTPTGHTYLGPTRMSGRTGARATAAPPTDQGTRTTGGQGRFDAAVKVSGVAAAQTSTQNGPHGPADAADRRAEVVRQVIKAYDVRGLVGEQLDAAFVRDVGGAFARLMVDEYGGPPPHGVVVGRDMRDSSPELAAAFAEGVTALGVDVVDIGLASTDMLYYASGALDAPGAMFTASHNPATYNGIKMCRAGASPIGQDTGLDEIAALLDRGPGEAVGDGAVTGTVTSRDLLDDYAAFLRSLVDLSGMRRLSLVVDAGNGMAGYTVPAVFDPLPVEIEPLYFELDGTFPNHEANPLDPDNLVDLQREVRTVGRVDAGLAFDGDADRVFVVDEHGDAVSPSAITALVATRELAKHPGATVIHNLITSRAVPEIVREQGGEPVRTRVGHSFIKATMAETGAVFGGEHSAHYYFRDFWRADSGMLAALHVLAALAEQDRPLSELMAAYERYAASGEINSRVDDAAARMTEVEQEFGDRDGVTTDTMDGLTVALPDGSWFNLRPSNTEPLLRLNVEAADDEAVAALRDEVLAVVRR